MERRANWKHPFSIDYQVGQWVWYQRPTAYVGPKMNASWMGPYQLTKRNGEHSYTLHFGPNDDREVHVDQLKPCWTHPATETLYPMVYRKGDPLSSTVESQVRRVLEAKTTPEGLQFLVQWSEEAGGSTSWVPARTLSPIWVQALEKVQAASGQP